MFMNVFLLYSVLKTVLVLRLLPNSSSSQGIAAVRASLLLSAAWVRVLFVVVCIFVSLCACVQPYCSWKLSGMKHKASRPSVRTHLHLSPLFLALVFPKFSPQLLFYLQIFVHLHLFVLGAFSENGLMILQLYKLGAKS